MIPTLDELRAGARVVDLPLRASFRGLTRREVMLFEGPSGWAEWAPFRDHGDAHSARWLLAAIEQGYGSWPSPARDRVPVNAIIPDLSAAASADWASAQLKSGVSAFKLKVGNGEKADLERVAAVRSAIGDAALRLDANARWSLESALELIPRLLEAGGHIEYFEQPCESLGDCAALRRELGVRVAVDEGVRLSSDPAALANALEAAADVLILKAIPLGGVRPALEVAQACGLPVVVSGSLDTSVGLASGLALAAALPELPYACGLGTGTLFAADVVKEPKLPAGGFIEVGRSVADGELLSKYEASLDVQRDWHERLTRCHALLVSEQRESL